MGRRLTDLADVCRRTGYPVVEVDGWQDRGRGGTGGNSTGGYESGKPSHVIVHHTASPASSDGWPDVNYCTFADDDAPLCNLYLSRDGTVYVCAAMATNCNGSGSDPCGLVADDSMNAAAIAIEAGNNGTGERWPDLQLDSYAALCAALDAAYGIPTGRIHAHAEYAPGRKTDPAGPDRYASGATTWNMNAFRDDCASSPPTPPIPEEDDVTDEDINRIAQAVWTHILDRPEFGMGPAPAFIWLCDTRAAVADVQANMPGYVWNAVLQGRSGYPDGPAQVYLVDARASAGAAETYAKQLLDEDRKGT